jgi:hypothetical protein
MRLFHAEPQIIQDFEDESEVVASKEHRSFRVIALRHPTLGKVVIVRSKEGDGIIVETEE